MKEILPVSLLSGRTGATASGTEYDMAYYFVSPGKRHCMATLSTINATGVATDTGSCIVKLQTSSTTVDTDFTDVTSGAFASVADTDVTTSAGTLQSIYFSLPAERYVRAYNTVVGTPLLDLACNIFLIKRES